MSLFDDHKAERRARILQVARDQVAARGYEGLTMRDLARAARVSVPTLYNLVGGKDAILATLLVDAVRRVAAVQAPAEQSFFGRMMIGFETGMRMTEESPEFFRQLIRLFLTSPEARGIRRRTELGFLALMTENLTAAKAGGQLVEWAEPRVVAGHMFALYMAAFLQWGLGELDLSGFRTVALSGLCHLLVGIARGRFAAEVTSYATQLTPDVAALVTTPEETQHVRTRSAD